MEGWIMADIKATSLGGIPKGDTSARPSSPNIGDPYYNGQTGVLEIYTSSGWQVCSAVPGAPTIGTATAVAASTRSYASGGSVSVPFAAAENGGFPTTYVVTSSPGGLFNSGSSSPIAVSGLTAGTAYTFSVSATNGFGNSVSSASSNSITPQTLPQAPTIGTASAVGTIGNVELTFTAGNAGGSSITNYKYSTDGTTYTAFSPAQTTSPLTISGLPTGVSTTISIKAVTANGDSLASSASNSVIPLAAKATGGTVYISGGYVYHKFTSTSTFVPSSSISNASILIIAGGGGATNGAGGAGGVVNSTSVSMSSGTTYTATVGAGGAGNNGGGSGVGATSGVNSTFTGGALSLTAAVGGGGAGGGWTGSGNGTNAKSGGSGGGGEMRYGVGGANVLDTGGAPTSGQGNAGGNGGLTSSSPNLKYCCGGGGGAGSAGGNANATSASGNGGNGTSAYSAWGSATSSGVNVSGTYYYAAASGGAAGGSSGSASSTNGIGFSSTLATNINTGNGGFGSQSSIGNRIGNSGIIIVRYQ
jgi:hypothetical protein